MKYFDIKKTIVDFGSRRRGILIEPVEKNENDHVIFPYDYAPERFGEELAKRGFRAFRVEQGHNPMAGPDDVFLMHCEAVEYCRAMDGIDTVLGMNWSGGNTAMTAYQAMAENGVEYFQNDHMLIKVSDLRPLAPLDGILTIDSNYGNGMMTLLSLDPAIVDETSAMKRDPELDLWNPANGFTPGGSTYSDAFAKKFQNAQGERMNRLVKYALDRVALIDQGKGNYNDDEPLIIPGGDQTRFSNKFFAQDVRYLGSTSREFPEIMPDGSVVNHIVKTVRPAMNDVCFTESFKRSARVTTVKSFLRECCAWTENFHYDSTHFYGVDWDATYCSTLGNVAGVTVPILSVGFTASWEFVGVETIMDRVGSKDKSAVLVKGAGHMGTPERGTEAMYGDTMTHAFDYIAGWIGDGSRFHK